VGKVSVSAIASQPDSSAGGKNSIRVPTITERSSRSLQWRSEVALDLDGHVDLPKPVELALHHVEFVSDGGGLAAKLERQRFHLCLGFGSSRLS